MYKKSSGTERKETTVVPDVFYGMYVKISCVRTQIQKRFSAMEKSFYQF